MSQKTIRVKVPEKKLVRIKKKYDRHWLFDFRGIRNRPPTSKREIEVLMGIRKGRSYHGEKPAFSSPEVLAKTIEEYFLSCYGPIVYKGQILKDDEGNIIKEQKKPFTVSGLAYYLDIGTTTFNRYCSGQMDDLGETDEDLLYSVILQRARQRIEVFAEESLYSKDSQPGARFVLDAHFGRTTQKEQAEISEKRMNSWIKAQELKLKKDMLDLDDSTDSNLTINIVRKE